METAAAPPISRPQRTVGDGGLGLISCRSSRRICSTSCHKPVQWHLQANPVLTPGAPSRHLKSKSSRLLDVRREAPSVAPSPAPIPVTDQSV